MCACVRMRGIILRDRAVIKLNKKTNWDRLDLKYVVVLYNEYYTAKQISGRIGKPEREIYSKINQLKKQNILKNREKRICDDQCFNCKFEDCIISCSEAMKRENKNHRMVKIND